MSILFLPSGCNEVIARYPSPVFTIISFFLAAATVPAINFSPVSIPFSAAFSSGITNAFQILSVFPCICVNVPGHGSNPLTSLSIFKYAGFHPVLLALKSPFLPYQAHQEP